VKPREPAHGRILCNREELTAGARCILECEAGYLAQAGELAVCQAGGRWAPVHRKLACVRPIAMLLGGFNAEEVGLGIGIILESLDAKIMLKRSVQYLMRTFELF
jgi:hypothetical protein